MNISKKIFCAFLLLIIGMDTFAQDPVIHYTSKGELSGSMPFTLKTDQKVKFLLSGSTDPLLAYEEAFQGQAKKAKKNIETLLKNPDNLKVLEIIYGINNHDIDGVLDDIKLIITNPRDTKVIKLPFLSTDVPYQLVLSNKPADKIPLIFNTETNGLVLTPISNDVHQLQLNLTKYDIYQRKVFDWLTATKTNFNVRLTPEKIADLKSYQALYKPLADAAKLLVKTNLDQPPTTAREMKAVIVKSADFLTKMSAINTNLKPLVTNILSANKDWILNWLWYQQDELPQLNPFNFVPQNNFQIPDTSGMQALRQKISTRDLLIKNADYEKVSTATLDKYIGEIDTMRKNLSTKIAAFNRFKKDSASNAQRIFDFGLLSKQINKGILYTSEPKSGPLYLMRHHNARDYDRLMNDHDPREYTEDDRVVILTHNLFATEQVQTDLNYSPIVSQSSFIGQQLEEGLTGLLTLAGKVGPQGALPGDPLNPLRSDLAKNLLKLRDQLYFSAAADYLIAQTNPLTEIKEVTSDQVLYHSENEETYQHRKNEVVKYAIGSARIKDTAAPKSESSGETAKPYIGLKSDTVEYRVNKLYRLFPMAGLAYTTERFYKSKGADGSVIETDRQTHFFIGLKVFIRKTDVRNSCFIAGKDLGGKSVFWSRTSFNAAVDLTNPLDNIYTGLGFDLWPGFCINTGMVLNKYTYYQNSTDANSITQSLYRPGFFVGISTDVNVITQLGKLLKL